MNKKRYERKNDIKMERYEGNRVKWLINKPEGLFLTRRSETLRRAGGKTTVLKKEESLQTKQQGKDPYRWRYLAAAVIVLAVGWILFQWKAER